MHHEALKLWHFIKEAPHRPGAQSQYTRERTILSKAPEIEAITIRCLRIKAPTPGTREIDLLQHRSVFKTLCIKVRTSTILKDTVEFRKICPEKCLAPPPKKGFCKKDVDVIMCVPAPTLSNVLVGSREQHRVCKSRIYMIIWDKSHRFCFPLQVLPSFVRPGVRSPFPPHDFSDVSVLLTWSFFDESVCFYQHFISGVCLITRGISFLFVY